MREGTPLGPEWSVARHTPDELVLEQRAPGWKKVVGSLVVSLGTFAAGLALALATQESARLIIWPLSALLLLVSVLGLPASLRNLQRARLGVRLRFTRELVEGWPLGFAFSPRRSPLSEVTRATVQVFPHPPLSLALLEVTLRDGTRLSGPEVAVSAGQPHPLDQVLDEIRGFMSANSATK